LHDGRLALDREIDGVPLRGERRSHAIEQLGDDLRQLDRLLAELLREEGHDVRTALDGVDALRAIKEWRPDVAILDVDMPRMSGPAIADELSRERGGLEEIPLVLLSGNADLELVGRGPSVHACMTKPVDPAQFIEEVDSAIRQP
jgi:CheY-like chemotaxis protein